MEMDLDNTVKDILVRWGFEDLVPIFKDNQINQEAFDSLTADTIKELIPKVGPRIIFSNKFALYKAPVVIGTPTSISTDDTLTDDASYSGSLSVDLQSPTASELEDESSPIVLEYLCAATVGMSQEKRSRTPYIHEQIAPQEVCLKAVNLQEILESTNKGRMILSSFKQNNKLDPNLRDKLTELIIEHEIQTDLNNRITGERFDTLANAIVGLFPNEVKELYFSYSLKRNHNGTLVQAGSGKLFRKFYNSRRILRKSGLLPKPNKSLFDAISEIPDDDDDKIAWLKNSIEPWSQLTEMWRDTFTNRSYYRTGNISIMEYMRTFPALKLQLGYTLLEIDFETQYPQCESFFTNIPNFANQVLQHSKKLPNKYIIEYLQVLDESSVPDVKHLQMLLLLPLLLRPVVVKKTKGAGCWKPSKIEVTEGFILHVKIPGDIKPSLERRRNKLASYGLTLQPIPVLVGQDLNSITSSYVAIDDVLYDVPTALKAIDVCFKCIHSFNACYSKESDMVWMMLQKGIYRINTKYDKKYIAVESLLKDLNC